LSIERRRREKGGKGREREGKDILNASLLRRGEGEKT